ncbi:uroporphyrinogen-III synthase [Algicella marina]|nr:uroporphyrinogen-III synthase [Algicella marina]
MDTQSRRQLLITRPEGDARRFSLALEHLRPREFECVFAPLLKIRFNKMALDFGASDVLVFTSRNGVRAYIENGGSREVPAICAGAATSALCEKYGLTAKFLGETAEAMLEGLLSEGDRSVRYCHLSGQYKTRDVAAELSAAGFKADSLTLYSQIAGKLPAKTLSALVDGSIDGVALFSPRSAEVFASEVKSIGLPDDFRMVCISENTAKPLMDCGGQLLVASEPSQEGVINAL